MPKASVTRMHRSDHDRQADPGNVGLRSARDSEAVTRMDRRVLDGDKITRLSAPVDNPDE